MFKKEKKIIVEYGNKLIKQKLTRSTGGNISILMREENIMLITPTSVGYDLLTEEDIIEMDLEGKQLSAFHQKPSSEWEMHVVVYKNRNDINAMFHAHAIYSMAISATLKSLPAIDYLVGFSGNYEVPVTNYASYGTSDIAAESLKVLKKMDAVILQNHGINTVGKNIDKAFQILDLLELCAEMYWRAKVIGEPRIIDKEEMMKMVKIFKKYNYGG